MAEAHTTSNGAGNKGPPVTGYPAPPVHSNYAAPYPSHPYPPPSYPAYPYPAPPPPPYAQSLRRASLLRRLVAAFIAACIVFGAITLVVWLVLRPRVPRFAVTVASVSPFNISSSQLTATWDITFAVDNPNKKMGVYYDTLKASVFYHDELLSETALPPFYQTKRNSTTVAASLASVSGYVSAGPAKNLALERARGQIKFDVGVVALVRFRAGAWRTRRRILRVLCEDVAIGFSSPSGPGLLSKRVDCDVGL